MIFKPAELLTSLKKSKFQSRKVLTQALILALAVLTPSCVSSNKALASPGKATQEVIQWKDYEKGKASWYGGRWHGRKTANGERYNQNTLTAAHKKLPFGTKVKVTNLRNGKSVVVRINNRGPYTKGRVIDLSVAAAKEIGIHSRGVGAVELAIVKK